jgi:hypothetical protein
MLYLVNNIDQIHFLLNESKNLIFVYNNVTGYKLFSQQMINKIKLFYFRISCKKM